MLYVICNANLVFDILYAHGIFIPQNEAAKAIQSAFDTGAFCLQVAISINATFIKISIVSVHHLP